MGGDIRVISEPGKGTTFNVYLPCIDAEAPQKDVREEDIPTGTERILAVDDEAPIVNLLLQNLELMGYRVSTTQSSEEALEMVRADPERFDLVITDMTGDVLAKKILAIWPSGFKHSLLPTRFGPT